MPTNSPHRIMLTLPADLHATLKRCAKGLDRPMATILLQMLTEAEPELRTLAEVSEKLREVDGISSQFLGSVLNRGLTLPARQTSTALEARQSPTSTAQAT